LAAEPGFWEFWYSVFSEDLKGSHVSPEPNIFLRAVAFIILFIGIPLLFIGTKKKQSDAKLEIKEKLKDELKTENSGYNNGVIQQLFYEIYKFKAPVSTIKLICNSNDEDGAAFFYRKGKAYIKEVGADLFVEVEQLNKYRKILSFAYWGVVAVLFILLTSRYWLHWFVDENQIKDAIYISIFAYITLMFPIAMILSKLKKMSSAVKFSEIVV